ncbi:TPA: hypothetical protein NPO92_000894 [Klebsiella quasipneumoniae subsp. quasipneumoniae]|nr:hypothetical protein [Klebsiella quasipneumoniae subsp. quasipneumoniae]
MNTFASDIHAMLKRLVSEETPNLSENDKSLLSHLKVALYNLLEAENGLESVYKVRFEDSGHLLNQQNAGMGPDSATDLKADYQILSGGQILNFLNILYLDNVKRYLSDRLNKITLVESGHVVNSMRKDESQRETKKRRNGGQRSRERMEKFKNHIHNLAMAFLEARSPRPSDASFTLKEVNAGIHEDVINFFKENPELPQSKKILLNPDNSPKDGPDATRAIADKLSLLRKEGRLRPFFEPPIPDQ